MLLEDDVICISQKRHRGHGRQGDMAKVREEERTLHVRKLPLGFYQRLPLVRGVRESNTNSGGVGKEGMGSGDI